MDRPSIIRWTLIIILFQFVQISCYSQISRTIWGMTLGKSSKQQVRTRLKNKGYIVQKEPNGSLSVKVDNINFGGAVWTYVSFSFVNGFLSQVWFQNNEIESPIRVDDTYEKIEMSLDKKYQKYRLNVPAYDDGYTMSHYSDSKTNITLVLGTYHNTRYVSLSYEDDYLKEKQNQRENDEL